MGIIRHVKTGRSTVLLGRTLVGRGGFCPIRLSDRYASQEHAVLWFAEGKWWLRDLDSRNGTYLDGERQEPQQAKGLKQGSLVAFGNPNQEWELIDARQPGPVAEDLIGGDFVAGDESLLLLPSEEEPEVAVYEDGQGGWLMEREGDVEPIIDHGRIEAGGRPWRLLLPVEPAATWESREQEVSGWELHFRVSADEEYVECDVVRGGKRVSLKPRAHTFALLTLARRRLEDADDAELPDAEKGWLYVDQLCKMLRADRHVINVYVFRARKQVASTGLGSPADLIERRSSSDQLRLGASVVTVSPLG